jgi:hypothetical protein
MNTRQLHNPISKIKNLDKIQQAMKFSLKVYYMMVLPGESIQVLSVSLRKLADRQKNYAGLANPHTAAIASTLFKQ